MEDSTGLCNAPEGVQVLGGVLLDTQAVDNGEVREGLTHGVNAGRGGTEVKHQQHAVELRGAGGA